MAGIKGNKSHANKTSYPNQKNNKKSPKVIHKLFLKILDETVKDASITSWQSACLTANVRIGKMNYWCKKIPIFAKYKKEIEQIIISRLNDGALNGDYNVTAAIFRQKILGEIEIQHVKNENTLELKEAPTIKIIEEDN